MDSDTFMINLPNGLKEGNMIFIKGIHKSDANEFTINFANDTTENPSDITYHFNWLVPGSIITEESRVRDQSWNRTEQDYYPFKEGKFELEFVFLEDGIHVYDAGHSTITVFKSRFKYSDIKSLQISGDVEKIQEVKFSFA